MAEQKQSNKERLKEITEGIEKGIQELFESDKYRQYLSTMSRFHRYSVNNTMLIYMQRPDATLVAGFNKWRDQFERHVKRGEHGITIIAPTPYKKKIEQEKLDPDTKAPMLDADGKVIIEEKTIEIPMFKPVKVFDVSQTDGKPLPQLASDLTGDVQNYEVFMEALRRSSAVPIYIRPIHDGSDGFFSLDDQSITIREGMSEIQTVSAVVHEIAHSKLHNNKLHGKLDTSYTFEEAELFGKPALFLDAKIDSKAVPDGLYRYELRGSAEDSALPAAVGTEVSANFMGTIITSEPIELVNGFAELDNSFVNFGGNKTIKAFYEEIHPEAVQKSRNTEEVEAESISYAVCAYYGIETGENSFGYLQYDRLQEMGMSHFDCWASRFGETVTALELAPEGTGYRARTRFSKFFNLPELMTLFKEVADIKTSDQLNLPTPEVEYHTVVAKPTEHQQDMVAALSERAAEVHAGNVDPSVDNMLKITSDGRKLGLDQRIINPLLPDQEGTKVNQCVSNIMKVWRDGETDKLTQLVFCDISTPKPAPSRKVAKGVTGNLDNPELHALETSIPLPEEQPGFTVYDDIRSKLIAQGVPPEQIAFIHEANTEVRKKELFAKVRTGQVRVLLGSTSKMGAGTNVQDRLVAIHDLDCPWRPGDLAQRKGRIERQGNQNPLVHVFRYVTEGTFDAYLWQTVENKQKFISQIMSSKSPVRSCDDVDETALSFAEIKALCAGDPRIKERMDLDVEVSRLKLMKADHQSKQFRMEDNLLKYFPEQIELNKGFIRGLETDMQTLAAHPHPEDGFAGMEIRGDVLTDKENAGAALLDAVTEVKGTEPVQIGSYRGFAMTVTFDAFRKEYELSLRGEMTHKAILGADPRGNLVRIDNALGQLQARLDAAHAQLDNLHQQQAAAQAEVGKPFPFEEELRVKTARLVLLDTELNMDGKKRPPAQREIAKSARPSVLEGLKKQVPTRTTEKKHKNHEEVL